MRSTKPKGFTIIELLVVIAIIGLLSTLAIIALDNARTQAKTAAANADLKQFSTAIELLQNDTGKWPNGCPVNVSAGSETPLSGSQVGLASAPIVGSQGGGCVWTAQDIANWKGPYITKSSDPWGHPYYFDPDYAQYTNCAGKTAGPITPSILSFGPNGVGVNAYDCDDIVRGLR